MRGLMLQDAEKIKLHLWYQILPLQVSYIQESRNSLT